MQEISNPFITIPLSDKVQYSLYGILASNFS